MMTGGGAGGNSTKRGAIVNTSKAGEAGITIDDDPYGNQGAQKETLDIKEIDAKFAGNYYRSLKLTDHVKKYTERI
jgi:hypothetical protein